MQVKVVEQGQNAPIRVLRANPKKGRGKTLAVFSNRDGRGAERVAAYVANQRHTIMDRIVEGSKIGTRLHETIEKFQSAR